MPPRMVVTTAVPVPVATAQFTTAPMTPPLVQSGSSILFDVPARIAAARSVHVSAQARAGNIAHQRPTTKAQSTGPHRLRLISPDHPRLETRNSKLT